MPKLRELFGLSRAERRTSAANKAIKTFVARRLKRMDRIFSQMDLNRRKGTTTQLSIRGRLISMAEKLCAYAQCLIAKTYSQGAMKISERE